MNEKNLLDIIRQSINFINNHVGWENEIEGSQITGYWLNSTLQDGTWKPFKENRNIINTEYKKYYDRDMPLIEDEASTGSLIVWISPGNHSKAKGTKEAKEIEKYYKDLVKFKNILEKKEPKMNNHNEYNILSKNKISIVVGAIAFIALMYFLGYRW